MENDKAVSIIIDYKIVFFVFLVNQLIHINNGKR